MNGIQPYIISRKNGNAHVFAYPGIGSFINPDNTVTLFLGGGIYTVVDASGSPEVTKYYSIAGQMVALNGPDGVQYLLTNHLGSVSAITDLLEIC